MSQRPQGYMIIEAIRREVERIFGLDAVTAQKAINTIDNWMRGIRGTRIIIP